MNNDDLVRALNACEGICGSCHEWDGTDICPLHKRSLDAITALSARAELAEKQLAAAVSDMKLITAPCNACKHINAAEDSPECDGCNMQDNRFEWRGKAE